MTSRHWLDQFWGRASRRPSRTRKPARAWAHLGLENLEPRTLPAISFIPGGLFAVAGFDGGYEYNPFAVATGDFNGDGKLDLVTTNLDDHGNDTGDISVALNPGTTIRAFGEVNPFHYFAGLHPWSVAVGDFNGDGKLDLAVANLGDFGTGLGASVSVLLGNGDGTFQTAVNYAVGLHTSSVAVGDFDGRHYANGQPILDLVVTGNSVSVLLNNGDGTFENAVNYAVGASSVAVADFNGDGKPDLVVTNGGSNIGVLLGNGNGTFQTVVNYAVGDNPASVAVGDFNGDGKPDLAVANQGSNNVSVLLNNGNGTFQAAVNYATGPMPSSIAVADFNGDGKPDLAVANLNFGGISSVSVLLCHGNGTFQPGQNFGPWVYDTDFSVVYPASDAGGDHTVPLQQGYRSLAVGDFTGDGKPDLAVVDEYDNDVFVLPGNGTRFFTPGTSYSSNGPGTFSADLNGDGIPDLITADPSSGISVLLGNGDGTFQSPVFYPLTLAFYVAVGDFNGDGKPDLAVARNAASTVSVLLNNGGGSFRSPVNYDTGIPPFYTGIDAPITPLFVADMNGDGKPDLVAASEDTSVEFAVHCSMLLGNGDGTFSAPLSIPMPDTHASGVAVGNLTSDGLPDIVITNYPLGGISVIRNNGDGTFQSPVSYAVGTNYWNVAVGDFNGDGNPDLAAVTSGGSSLGLFLGNGDGTFRSPVYTSLSGVTDRHPPMAVADFTGDGREDLLLSRDYDTVVLLPNGDGTFQTFYDYVSPFNSSVQAAVADFNGDGRLDVAVGGRVLLDNRPAVTLSSASVTEHLPAGTVVGTFSTAHPDDPGNFFNYQLVSGSGGADNAAFTLTAGGTLQTAATFDYATKSSYAIRVRSTDAVGVVTEKAFTIHVTPRAEQFSVVPAVPSVLPGTPFSVTVTAQDAAGYTAVYVGTVHFSSTDPEATLPADYTFTAADNGSHTFSGVVFGTTGSQNITAGNGGLGGVVEFAIPTANSSPYGITAGPDGNLWFVEQNGNKVGRISPAGAVTEFPIPTGGSVPLGIATGPDGNLWFVEAIGNKVGRITPAGAVTEFPIPTSSSFPFGITAGPDGNLWFVEAASNKVGKMTPAGVVTEYPIPTANSSPYGITAGPDGNLWFVENSGNKAGRITPAGAVTEFPIPTGGSSLAGITAGPDGNLWFTEGNGNQLGRITPAGVVTEFPIPTSGSAPDGITAGLDGNLWFTEANGNKIGRMNSATLTGSASVSVPGPATDFVVTTTAANPDVAGTPFSVTVTAVDSNGLTAIGYTGTIHFSSGDPYGASLPADYTFQAGD